MIMTAAELRAELVEQERMVAELIAGETVAREAFRLGMSLARLVMRQAVLELAIKEVLPPGRGGRIMEAISLPVLEAQARVLNEKEPTHDEP